MEPMSCRIVKVNPARPDVAHELMRLQALCLPGDVPANVDEGWWWIAYDGDEAVGFAAMVPSAKWLRVGYLNRAGVAPSHRGRGLQKRLIRVRVAHARRLGYDWLVTDTTDNLPSANSLIAAGFRLFKPSEPWAWRHSLYWRLRLSCA